MKVCVAGATAVVGRRLVPTLVAAGHQVTAMTHSPEKVVGAEAVVADGLDRDAVLLVLTGIIDYSI